jgi:pimeloyl-ACP methyl ester carboxylesterase
MDAEPRNGRWSVAPDLFEAETRYARHPEGHVAYQAFGRGSIDLMFTTSWLTNVDAMWQEPSLAAYLRRLAAFSRVICFDRRGTDVSDPVTLSALPTLDRWIDDARVVMDAVGSTQVAMVGDAEGGPLAMLFAATHPDRTTALVLVNSFARWSRADDYPIGMPLASVEKLVERCAQHWGVTADILDLTAPSVAADAAFRRWFLRYQRLAMPPGAAATMYRWVTQLDVRSVLPAIRVPTLVLPPTRKPPPPRRVRPLSRGQHFRGSLRGARRGRLISIPRWRPDFATR